MPEALTDNTTRRRFELGLDGALGYIEYRRSGATLYLNHAEVPRDQQGRGLGTRLVLSTFDLIRTRGERMVAVCPFVRAVARTHPEYAELSAE